MKTQAGICALLLVSACGALESPTEPRAVACDHPAALTISVTPLRDPEFFGFIVDTRYDVDEVANRLRRHFDLERLEMAPFIHAGRRRQSQHAVILSGAKDLKLRRLRSFAVFAASG